LSGRVDKTNANNLNRPVFERTTSARVQEAKKPTKRLLFDIMADIDFVPGELA
jgi:hypothetical protein